MEIKVLGPGCQRCSDLYAETEKALTQAGVPATLTKVKDMDEILAHQVLMTPALVIDGQVVCAGRVPRQNEIVTWIMNAAARG